MVLFCGDEEDVSFDEGEARVFDEESSRAFHDDVELVLFVAGLVVVASRREDDDGHGAVFEDRLVPDAFRPGGGGRQRQVGESRFEVDAHEGIVALSVNVNGFADRFATLPQCCRLVI